MSPNDILHQLAISFICTSFSKVQSKNARSPIDVILFPIVTLVSEVHVQNSWSSIVVTPLPITTLVRAVQR